MRKTLMRILVPVMIVALAFTVVHFAVLGNNSPTDTAFTFKVEDGSAILTGSADPLSGAVVLPDTIGGYTVTGIGEGAFKNCADVTAFFLPDTITHIDAYAFENCSGLVQAILPDGLASIGDGAFWRCSGISSITVPANVSAIGSCAFYKCDALESLIILGASTPVEGAFNVALDIGQTLAIGNPARQALDPITTTVYCYKNSVAYSDALRDGFTAYALLDDCALTSYTIHYVDEADAAVAPSVTLNTQPVGIHVAAVATVVDDEELVYPDPAVQTIELTDVDADNTMTFVYTVRTYTITFDAAGGEDAEPMTYASSDVSTLPGTQRAGYTFKGWQPAPAEGETHYSWGDAQTLCQAGDAVTGQYGNATMTAVWEANSIEVTFDAQGGTVDPATLQVKFADTYGALPEAVREGYTFDGWYNLGGVKVESTTTVTDLQPHTLYARWTINKYDVTVLNDGNGTASADLTENVEYGTLVTLTAQPNKGFSFSAWTSEDVTVADDTFTMPDKAVTVTATFTANDYTITFDTAGGDEREPLTYKTTDTATIGGATRAGYTLVCWALSGNAPADGQGWSATARYSVNESLTGKVGSVTLQALWRGNAVTVQYDAQGGSTAHESTSVTVGGTYGTLDNATRVGYTFGGWFTEADGGSKIEQSTTVSQTANHTIYAHWTINKYNVTLATDNNGFVSASATTDVEYGTTVTLTATPKAGFAFSAWVSNDVNVEDNAFTMPDKAVLVRATFAPVTYTVTFDTDGGNEKAPLSYVTTDETALGGAEKAGYSFVAWQVSVPAASGDYNWGSTSKTYNADQTVRGKYGDVTLKANWEGNAITATYDAQGGTADAASTSVTVGGAYGELAGAVREGYTFTGWFTEAEGGTQIVADTPVTQTADHTIYAHWTINQYAVTVTTDGNGTASADLTENVAYGTTVTLTAEAATGYTFAGWECTDAAIENDAFTMPDKAVTVKATFSANAYVIAFDANGGENTMEPIDATYDEDVVLPANTFERAGYAFLGWADADDAEEPVYEDGDTVLNLTANAGETVTLFAVWKDIKVELIAKEGSTTVIDEGTHFIYGLKEGVKKSELLNTYLDVVGNGSIVIHEDKPIGTGTVVDLVNNNTGEVVDTYMLVIFGDADGNGRVNKDDVTVVQMMNVSLREKALTNVYAFAANVYKDSMVGTSDITLVRMMAASLATIDQATRERIS